MKLILLTAVTGSIVATGALADESRYDWSGVYVGAQIGYASGESRFFSPAFGAFSDPDPSGLSGGLYIGYNYQFTNGIVVGVDADVSLGGVAGNDIITSGGGAPTPTQVVSADVNIQGAVRARLGYAIDRVLPFIAGGITFADYDHTYTDSGFTPANYSGTYRGWTAGAGIEYALTNALLMRGEYRYSDFESIDHPASGAAMRNNLSLKTQDLRLGIGFKF